MAVIDNRPSLEAYENLEELFGRTIKFIENDGMVSIYELPEAAQKWYAEYNKKQNDKKAAVIKRALTKLTQEEVEALGY